MKNLLLIFSICWTSYSYCVEDDFTQEDLAELERGLEYASDKELEAMAKATNASMASTFSMIFAVHEDISSEEASIKGFCAASFFKIEPTKKAIIGYFQRAVDSTPEEFFEILKDNKEEFRECIEKPRL